MITIDYFPERGYSYKQAGFEKDYLTKKEVLGYLNLLNSNCSYTEICQ